VHPAVARRLPIPVALDMRLAARLAEPVEIAAYYLDAETFTNTAKHANAVRVAHKGYVADGRRRVSMRDEGPGDADPARVSGLLGRRDRVEVLGGTITIASPQGEGPTLVAKLRLADTFDRASRA
jgi:signal transduction histidine kinase